MSWVPIGTIAESLFTTGAVKTLGFDEVPDAGELLVFEVSVNTTAAALLAAESGILTSIPPSESTFRTLAQYHMISDGIKNLFEFSIDPAITTAVIFVLGRRFGGETLASVGTSQVVHDVTTTNTVSASVAASAGGLVVAQAYNTVTDTKTWSNATGGTWTSQFDYGNFDRLSSVFLQSAGATETATITLDTQTNNRLSIALVEYIPTAGSTLVVDSAPAQIRSSDTGLTITVSGVTASNITNISQVDVRLVNSTGVQLTPTAYNYTSATVVEITFSVPASLAIQYDSTGYAIYLDLNTETISTTAIPYLPVATKDFINLAGTIVKSIAWDNGGSYVDTTQVYDPTDNRVYTSGGVVGSTTAPSADAVNFTYLRPHQSLADGWSEDEPVVGTQAVYDKQTSGLTTITPAADGTISYPAITEDETFTVFFIKADGTVGSEATITLSPNEVVSLLETTILQKIVKSIIRNI